MKFTFKAYELKNKSAPGTKTKQLKSSNNKPNKNLKKRGGVIDNRKYVSDTTLSEAEKISRRMALENMRRKSSNKPKKSSTLFPKDDNKDDEWENDPFNLKAKQIDELDLGLDESSDEENKEADTEKYFKKGKRTLDEIIRDSKIEKFEKSQQKEKELEATAEVNEQFNKNIRFVLPKLGSLLNGKTAKDFQKDKVDYGAVFQQHYESLIFAPKLPKADVKSILAPVDSKEKDKLVNMKIKRLREHLIKEGIANDDGDDGNDDKEDTEGEEEESGSEEEDDIDVSDLGQSSDENEDEEEEQDEEDSECSDDDDGDQDDSDGESDNSGAEEGPAETTLEDLKKLIFTRNKAAKRQRISDESMSPETNKKSRLSAEHPIDNESARSAGSGSAAVDPGKTEIECLRVLLQMPDMRQDAIFALADALDNRVAKVENNVGHKLVLASLLLEALSLQSPDRPRYSPELVRSLTGLLATAVTARQLDDDTDMTGMPRSALIDMCTLASNNLVSNGNGERAVSELWHIVSLLSRVTSSYGHWLANGTAVLAEPIQSALQSPGALQCLSRCPHWLGERVQALTAQLAAVAIDRPIPALRMRRRLQIVALLEPDLTGAARHDPRRDVTKALQLRVKQETRNARRDLRESARLRVGQELAEARHQARVRKQKTLEIVHGINQA